MSAEYNIKKQGSISNTFYFTFLITYFIVFCTSIDPQQIGKGIEGWPIAPDSLSCTMLGLLSQVLFGRDIKIF